MAVPPVTPGVAGGAASGKTTVARFLLETVGSEYLAVLPQDMYYVDMEWQDGSIPENHCFDHPSAIDTALPAEPEIRELPDFEIFADTDADVRLARRIQRDMRDRGREIEKLLGLASESLVLGSEDASGPGA